MQSTPKLPTPDFLITQVTRQDDELLFHTHGGTVHTYPVGSVGRTGTNQRPGVSVRDPEGQEVYSAPLTRDALAQLAVCLHGDGLYSWVETQAYGPSVPVTARVHNGQVISYTSGTGNTASFPTARQLREGQAKYINGIYTALRLAARFAPLGAEAVSFTPAPAVPFHNEMCDGCGLLLDGYGSCPTCEDNERAWNTCLDDLEVRLNPILDGWASEWATRGMRSVDLSSAMEMALGIIRGQRVAGF